MLDWREWVVSVIVRWMKCQWFACTTRRLGSLALDVTRGMSEESEGRLEDRPTYVSDVCEMLKIGIHRGG